MRFAYRFTVDRHGLRPRDDKKGLLPCYCLKGEQKGANVEFKYSPFVC
jgi:hypothetical protein